MALPVQRFLAAGGEQRGRAPGHLPQHWCAEGSISLLMADCQTVVCLHYLWSSHTFGLNSKHLIAS